MPFRFAMSGKLRVALTLLIATGLLAANSILPAPLVANSDRERTIAIYNIHNKETVKVVYKRNGQYVPSAMKKLNWVMRDWRRNEATTMDPKLIDTIWAIHTELGSRKPVHLISGYRSRKTNNGLRKSRGGQAKNSRHILGKAADIHFPDVPVRRVRYSGLVREQGGVGYYPTSALPFVHIDTGRVRHWPRIGRDELALLTKGRSKHIPRGGRAVTKSDYRRALKKNSALVRRVAAFHTQRRKKPGRTAIASLDTAAPMSWSIPQPIVAKAPAKRKPAQRTAALTQPKTTRAIPKPAAATRPVALKNRRKPKPAPEIRVTEGLLSGLDEAPATSTAPKRTTLASLADQATRPTPAAPALKPAKTKAVSVDPEALPDPVIPAIPEPPTPSRAPREDVQIASIAPDTATTVTDVLQPDVNEPSQPFFELSGWATAPQYDDEHAGELSYRPFPIGPLLTASPSIDDPFLARLVHPDLVGARDLVGRDEEDVPLRFKPGLQYAEMLWSDIFAGGGVNALLAGDPALRPWAQETSIAQQ